MNTIFSNFNRHHESVGTVHYSHKHRDRSVMLLSVVECMHRVVWRMTKIRDILELC